jgi:hypothetical protein
MRKQTFSSILVIFSFDKVAFPQTTTAICQRLEGAFPTLSTPRSRGIVHTRACRS